MSGGHFDYWQPPGWLEGAWLDHEVNDLVADLFCGGEFAVRGYGGLLQSLDFYLSGDTGEGDYRDAVARFKTKWMHRTPKNRIDYYCGKLQDCADRLKAELAGTCTGEER